MTVTNARRRRGFSLLEVMVALAILVVSLVILVETQSNAVVMTVESQRVIVATDLANAKLTEVMLLMEEEGFGSQDIYEAGDFDDFGDDVLDREFGNALEDYHWEYSVAEVDMELAGDIAGMAGALEGSGILPGDGGGGVDGGGPDLDGAAGAAAGLGGLMSPEMITEMLGPYIREVRVRIWWGEDTEKAEENGQEIVLTTHIINPAGAVNLGEGGLPF